MCRYIRLNFRCRHAELLAGPNCNDVSIQLSRIHNDASAWSPEGCQTLPFQLLDSCHPGPWNTVHVVSGECCGWECRNTYPADPIDSTRPIEGQFQDITVDNGTQLQYIGDGGRMPWYLNYSGIRMSSGMNTMSQGSDAGGQENAGGAKGGTDTVQTQGRLGMPDAEYGVSRLGVGWRYDAMNGGYGLRWSVSNVTNQANTMPMYKGFYQLH